MYVVISRYSYPEVRVLSANILRFMILLISVVRARALFPMHHVRYRARISPRPPDITQINVTR